MDDSPDRSIKNFQKDFVKGCITFLTIAMQIKGDVKKTPDELMKEFIGPIIGNRNPENIRFQEVIPELFKKVNIYCEEAIDISNRIENNFRI